MPTHCDALGGKRHQALLDDITGMLEVGRECQYFRQAPMIGFIERVAIEDGRRRKLAAAN